MPFDGFHENWQQSSLCLWHIWHDRALKGCFNGLRGSLGIKYFVIFLINIIYLDNAKLFRKNITFRKQKRSYGIKHWHHWNLQEWTMPVSVVALKLLLNSKSKIAKFVKLCFWKFISIKKNYKTKGFLLSHKICI